MIAYAERSATLGSIAPLPAPAGEAARALAAGFLQYASACWRGEQASRRFATRLGAYWRPQLPPAPIAPPAAFSPHGAGGRGIGWYQLGDEVLGYIPGSRAGYRVPVEAVARLLACISSSEHPTPLVRCGDGVASAGKAGPVRLSA